MQPWQEILSNAITDPEELFSELDLNPQLLNGTVKAIDSFSLRVPRGFVARMEKGNPNDPLLLQVLPTAQELNQYPGYSQDPLGEKQVNPVPGLLHKYHGRVLLTVTSGCAINCRYCFRRHFPYEENIPGNEGWKKALNYIANDNSIEEVIFSGGDPLILKVNLLANLAKQLEAIPHIKRLRIHTRLPIVIPERIDNEFIDWIQSTPLKSIVVVHCNHPNEIDDAVTGAMKKLQAINITLLNQSVLLKNVNDHADTLIQLSHKLFGAGVMPYYLHLLDRVHGSAHFEVSELKAKQLMQQMMHRLPGYLIPKLVREVPGAWSKVLIIPSPSPSPASGRGNFCIPPFPQAGEGTLFSLPPRGLLTPVLRIEQQISLLLHAFSKP